MFLPLAAAFTLVGGLSEAPIDSGQFALSALLYGARQAAGREQQQMLHQLLLGYEPSEAVDRRLPSRRALARAVARWPLSARRRMLAFVVAHPEAVTNYSAVVVEMFGPAPGFVPVEDDQPVTPSFAQMFADRRELAALLREVWGPLGGAQLWRRLERGQLHGEVRVAHWQAVERRVAMALGVAAPPPMTASRVLLNPLLPENAAVSCAFGDGHFVLVIGPTGSAAGDDALLAHELAHPLVEAALAPGLLVDQDCAWAAVRGTESAVLVRYVYTGWRSYFAEALIRALVRVEFPSVDTARPLFLEPALAAAWREQRGPGPASPARWLPRELAAARAFACPKAR